MAQSSRVTIAALSDTHYGPVCAIPERRSDLAIQLIGSAIRHLEASIHPDVLTVPGDLLDNGTASDAGEHLRRIDLALKAASCPVLVIPGNHDAYHSNPAFRELFGEFPRRLDLTDATLLVFADRYGEGDAATRDPEDIEWLERQDGSMKEIRIAIQHTPLFPDIEWDYPYNLKNRKAVHAAYRKVGIRFSLSGHYHAGIDPIEQGKIRYACVPALCEMPFRYAVYTIEGNGVGARYFEATP